MVKRTRLRLRQRVKVVHVERTADYFRLRYWWLHHLRQLRAKRRVAGIVTKNDIKAAQRALGKLRQEEQVK